MVPTIRIRDCNQGGVRGDGQYVLYWMIASRRLNFNFALDRALEHCRELHRPLLIFEALRCGYQWASDRFHRFVIDGMADNAARCATARVTYFPYVEPVHGQGKGLLKALAGEACVVVTDEFPCFFLPRMVAAAATRLKVKMEAVDSNGLLPLRAAERAFSRAFDFRRHLQKVLPEHLAQVPCADALSEAKPAKTAEVPKRILAKWPAASAALLAGKSGSLASLRIDHQVQSTAMRGGHTAAVEQMKRFMKRKFAVYGEEHNAPELRATSNLSPYLHFGYISAHEIFGEITRREKWKTKKLALRATGARTGWWNMTGSTENYLDQLVTWREVGYNFTAHRDDYDRYESLPAWARETLDEHARDQRTSVYTLEEFEAAETHDALWNAAQIQLRREGYIHNYMRMLWGKKILEWSESPREATKILIQLNNKYSLDGRNPNSYSGIFWCLGRYDRAWGPERPIFGKIRYMSSENAARKFSVKNYIQRYSN